ncbi:MAG TPA: ester cyclase [Terriglobales bacterium]|nr:ester cyclase [Terriglobales bacterium]
MSEANKKLARRFIEEALNKGDFRVIDEVVSKDYIYREPTLGESKGPEGCKQLLTSFRTAFPDVACTIVDQIAEGDRLVTRWTARGTHRGELLGIAPTNKPVTLTGVVISRFAQGKLVEDFEIFDALGLMRQLGVVPATVGKAA